MVSNDGLLELSDSTGDPTQVRLVNLTAWQVRRIDRLLTDVGPFGEVRIIKEKGRVSFVEKIQSIKMTDGPASSGN